MVDIHNSNAEGTANWQQLGTDWDGLEIDPPVEYRFALSRSALSFEVRRAHPARAHPSATMGRFQAELWKYDVAEFFLTDPMTRHYLEVNLAPNGAWWCCEFVAPRDPHREHPRADIIATGSLTPEGWSAQIALPRAWLEEDLHFGPESRLNATFILDSPEQRFLTACPLPGPQPDFHQPSALPQLSINPGL